MTDHMNNTEIEYIKQEKDKQLYTQLKKKLEEVDLKHDKALTAVKKANDTADKIWNERRKIIQEIRNVTRRLSERARSRTLYTVDFRAEMELYSPKVVFENKYIISAIFSDSNIKVEKALEARIQEDLTWEKVFEFIDPMEIYIVLKTIILKRFYKDTAYTIGGNMDEDKVKAVEIKAFKKMRKMKFIEAIYKWHLPKEQDLLVLYEAFERVNASLKGENYQRI